MRYKYAGINPEDVYSCWESGYCKKICSSNLATMKPILPNEEVIFIYEYKNALTFYVPRLLLSVSTNQDYFDTNFIPIPINYNDYWAKLNE